MNDINKNNNPHKDHLKDFLDSGAGAYIKWDKSREQIWLELEKKLEPVTHVNHTGNMFSPWLKIAMAAVITLLIGVAVLMQWYTKKIDVPAGLHSQVILPDQSVVRLNAKSTLSYKPLLWSFSRTIHFEGEAFFEVQKGRKFEVISSRGKTAVLGTSFNIYTRSSEYQVVCITGKVKVYNSAGNQEILLKPAQKASLNQAGTFTLQNIAKHDETLAWMKNIFSFTSIPLKRVFEEISRQYGVVIHLPDDLDFTYTGTFKRDIPLENVLNMVCKPFGITYTQQQNQEYNIIANE
jgi:transmembrane sensor